MHTYKHGKYQATRATSPPLLRSAMSPSGRRFGNTQQIGLYPVTLDALHRAKIGPKKLVGIVVQLRLGGHIAGQVIADADNPKLILFSSTF